MLLTGSLPSELCDITSLVSLSFANNPDISCYAKCLSTVSDLRTTADVCPTAQETAVCAFVAATNIANLPGYDEWACSSSGIPATDPCGAHWTGLDCEGSAITSFHFKGIRLKGDGIIFVLTSYHCFSRNLYSYVSGTIPSGLGQLSSLTKLDLEINSLTGE